MSNWTRKIEVGRVPVANQSEVILEPYQALLGDGRAHVDMGVSITLERAGSWIKISSSVELTCAQEETAIDKAGEKAFYKALELTADGITIANDWLDKNK